MLTALWFCMHIFGNHAIIDGRLNIQCQVSNFKSRMLYRSYPQHRRPSQMAALFMLTAVHLMTDRAETIFDAGKHVSV